VIQVLRETHETPAEVEEAVARAGGSNLFGEPSFRVVWGWNRLTWIGGKWDLYDSQGNYTGQRVEMRREPKHLPVNRWHVERWMPPASYGSPRDWDKQTTEIEGAQRIASLGPYPSRGDYEHCFTLAGPAGEFIPLSAAACEWVVRAVLWAKGKTRGEGRAALIRHAEKQQRDYETHANDVLGL